MPNSPSNDFAEVVRQIRGLKTRNEIEIDEVPAPQKLAPFSLALTAQVSDEEATGRFVLLHDPAGQEGWSGKYRCVTFVRADIETDMVSDPLLSDLGWAWLMESLAKLGCNFLAPSGTVTRVASSSFGTLNDREDENEVEVRASWTPVEGENIADHVRAWIELLEIAAGLAPIPEGVTQLTPNNS
jgi:hypothetical protein